MTGSHQITKDIRKSEIQTDPSPFLYITHKFQGK
ncbi:unnamed protein product [Paramecium octaurelia]|uniref:Uncharacterized protein n=1 Tax=Paramecium octaurelia TaxID=43137 RepID=A0A8S1YH70_PAROT|nr:unnamed protein product [Paramecium octaurelia]